MSLIALYYFKRFILSPYGIAFALLISFLWGLGALPLFDLDEGAFTEATREMIASGNYAATFLDGEPRYDKPILFYWLQAASIHLLGFNEWAFRLPSFFMACLWALALWWFARETVGRYRAHIAVLLLISCLWVALIARSAIADATLNLFLSLTLFDIWRYFSRLERDQHNRSRARSTKWPLYRVYLWMALGTLTKGPVAVAIPLFISVIYLISIRAQWEFYKAYFSPVGWAIFIAAVTPWLWAVYQVQGDGFFQGFIVEHNLKRFANTRESHGGFIFYYALVLPFILLPFSALLVNVFKNVKRRILDNRLERFLFIWFCVIFIIFSFSKTQLPHYILNACVPLIILFSRNKNLQSLSLYSGVFPLIVMLFLCALPWLVPLAIPHSGEFERAALARHAEVLNTTYILSSLLCFVLMALVLFSFPNIKHSRYAIRPWQRLVASGIILNAFVFTTLAKSISEFQEKPIHDMIHYLQSNEAHLGETTVVAFKMHMPSFSVYRQQITPLRAPTERELVMTRVDRLKQLDKAIYPLEKTLLFQSGPLHLYRVARTKPDPGEAN